MEISLLSSSPPDWEALIARHGRRVLLALLGEGVPIERAKELAQETWARLMQQHARGALPRLELPGLAVRQAIFLARDDARRDRRRPVTSLSESMPDLAAATDAELVAREQSAVALAVLQQLPANARKVFELAYDDPSLTHQEIAARVGLSLQRVRQILCEVRKALRAALEVVR